MKTPYILKRKPLSQSPRRYIKIPELSISDGDTEEAHFKPYVLVNNTRPSLIPSTPSAKENIKKTPELTVAKLDEHSDDEYYATIKKIEKIEEEKLDPKAKPPKGKNKMSEEVRKTKSEKQAELKQIKRDGISKHICCMLPELNPNNKDNPFELVDDTAYERSRYSHQKIGKYSTVIERIRSSKGNRVKKVISVNLSLQEQFGNPSFDKIFQDFYIIGVENK